jgi:hypothetical protein
MMKKVRFGERRAGKAMSSLNVLTSFEIWKERNAMVFKYHVTFPAIIIAKIKGERIWSFAREKFASNETDQMWIR